MTQVPVKERRPSLLRTLARRVLRKRTLAAFAAAIALVLLFHYVLMPWIVRDRVRAALETAGLRDAKFRVTRATLWATDIRDLVLNESNRVDRVRVRYNVHDLWEREVREIAISGATLSADPNAWPIEPKKPATRTATTATSKPKQPMIDLPFLRLRVEKSQLVLANGEKIPVEGTFSKSLNDFMFHAASPQGGLDVSGTLTRRGEGTIAVDASNVAGSLIRDILRTYVANAAVAISGDVSGKVRASWGNEGVIGHAALEIAGGSIENASDAKLIVGSGVFVGEASIGTATTRPAATLSIKADRADIATPDLKAYGVGGAVTLTSLSPPVSAPRQKLSAQRLKIGETEFANGQLEFEVTESGDILVRQTRWDFLGGQVYANDVQVPRQGPTKLTLRAENVDLRDILQTYAKDKLDGRGKISGELPIVINGRDIRFGEGQLNAGDGGELKIKDPDTLAHLRDLRQELEKIP